MRTPWDQRAAGVDYELTKNSPPPLRCIPWFWRLSSLPLVLVLVLSAAVLVIVLDRTLQYSPETCSNSSIFGCILCVLASLRLLFANRRVDVT